MGTSELHPHFVVVCPIILNPMFFTTSIPRKSNVGIIAIYNTECVDNIVSQYVKCLHKHSSTLTLFE